MLFSVVSNIVGKDGCFLISMMPIVLLEAKVCTRKNKQR